MKNRTIVHLQPHFEQLGGSSIYVLELAQSLTQFGYRSQVFTIQVPQKIINQYPEINFVQVGGKLTSSLLYWIFFPFFLIKLIFLFRRKAQSHLILSHAYPSNWWGSFLSWWFPLKHIWVAHDPSYFLYNHSFFKNFPIHVRFLINLCRPFLQKIDQLLAQSIDKEVVNSHYLATKIQQIYNFSSQPIVITPGLNHTIFFPSAETPTVDLLVIGRLSSYKHIDSLLKALAILKDKQKRSYTLKIVGEGEDEMALRHLSNQLNLQSQVSFQGLIIDRQDLATCYRKSKLHISLSEIETFGMVVFESMACGVPSLVIKKAAFRELEDQLFPEQFLQTYEPSEVAQKINTILQNPRLLKKLRNYSLKLAQSYDWEKTTQKLIDLF